MKVEILTRPQGKVLGAFRDCRDRRMFIMGPLGSAKTNECCQKIFALMCEQEPYRGIRRTRWFAIRNTYSDLHTTTIRDWLELYGDLGKYKGGGAEPPSHKLRFHLIDKTVVEAEMIFLALDRPGSVKKLKSTQVTGVWLNETCELDKAVVDEADLRTGRFPPPWEGGATWHGMLGDTNAPDEDSWYYYLAEEVKPEGWTFFKQPGGVLREMRTLPDERVEWTGGWVPNPNAENLQNLPKNYYKDGMQGKSDQWIAVRLANEYGAYHTGKPVYEHQWNRHLHIDEKIEFIEGLPIIVGLDFGLTPAAVIGQVTPRGRLQILDELMAFGMGINQFATGLLLPLVKNKYRKASDVIYIGDPAGNQRAQTDEVTVFKELSSLGVDAEPANTNDPDIRWEAVRWFLQQLRDGKGAFAIHPRCKTLIKGFDSGYQFKRVEVTGSEPKYSERAEKNKYSHPHDGLQYLAMYVKGDDGDTPSRLEDDRTVDETTLWGA